MAEKGSVFQKGGGGTNFEQAVQTAFLTTLIIQGNAPLNHANEVIEVAFQTTNRGCETDDLLVVAKSAIGEHRLLVQVKHNITFSADNSVFKDVISAFWKDYTNPVFDKQKDRLIIAKSGLTKDERNHLKSLLNWAKTHATEKDFMSEVDRIKAKKNKLNDFRAVLKAGNNDTDLSDNELWEFLKCVDVLEYDFTNQNSVDEAYFLNLIKLSKNGGTTSNEKEIWDTVLSFASKLNKDGGSVTRESIQKEELYKHFDTTRLSPYFKAIEKLRKDSDEILAPIKNTIGDFHLDRRNISHNISDAVNDFQFTLVTGKPGVGKSAIIKDALKNELTEASIFVFRADQFNEPHIAHVFSSQGVNESIQDVFSCISLIPGKVIFIDSLEKLLEADPECAFKQLLALLKRFPDIKVLCSSRKYAVELIIQKFGIDKNSLGYVDVMPLDEDELKCISDKLPQLQAVLKNEKIKSLLQSPKYLDFSILALNKSEGDFSNMSLTEFKHKLWNTLIVDSTTRRSGLPIKREKAFMEIAVNRAKEMKLFTKPINADAEAIDLLENDEMLFQERQNRKYSPSHDILEDWALVKYVSEKFDEYPQPQDFFKNLGTEPAIRRAFRLWVEDYLVDDSDKVNGLIRLTLEESAIEPFWADELLIAVFKSENSRSFFIQFKDELLKNHTTLFIRCLHIIKTCCKESDLRESFNLLIPKGSGWEEAIYFISEHIDELVQAKLPILNFLSDWHFRLTFRYDSIDERELQAAKLIVLHYINEVESRQEFWQERYFETKSETLVSILFDLAEIAKDEITQLLERAYINKEQSRFGRASSFYEGVIDKCVSGLGSQRLVRELPDLVVNTMWKEWKLKPKHSPTDGTPLSLIKSHRLEREECWGIQDNRRDFSPSGIYKTPLYHLLWYHPQIGLEFMTQFINYAVDFYVNADCEYKHNLVQVEIELNDGTKVTQWAGWELWAAYRGTSVTHYALESLLMSFEKFLLETAAQRTDVSKLNVKFIYDYILRNSNNVAAAAVLVSVLIAYPDEVEEAMLPLLSVKEFYNWDLNRALQESSTLAPVDTKIRFAQQERIKSNQLPHRRKYMRGIRDFIVNYQFNVRKLNKEIHQVFDKLKKNLPSNDIVWQKTLTEIDIRNHKVGKYDEKLGGFPIQPEYDDEVTEFMESGKEEFEADSKSMSYSGQLTKSYESNEPLDFTLWNTCYQYYSSSEYLNFLYDRPVTLAVLGLRDFAGILDSLQKEWCIGVIENIFSEILKDTLSSNYGLNPAYNLLEKKIALTSFHLLFNEIDEEEHRADMIEGMIYMLMAPFSDHEIDEITTYIRNVFFKQHPIAGKRVWYGLIRCSKFRKENPYFYDDHDKKRLFEARKKEQDFIENIAKEKVNEINLSEVSLDTYEGYLLARAFVITPYYIKEKAFRELILHFIPLLFEDINHEEDYNGFYASGRKRRQIHHQSETDALFYLSELLIMADSELAKSVLDLVIDPVYKMDMRTTHRNGLFEFSSKVPDYAIYKLDDIIANSDDEKLNKELIERFWVLWEHFFEKIKSSGRLYFTKTLFLDIDWKKESIHWKALEGKKDFYYKMMKELGKEQTQSIINLFSTAGEKTFLPEGISWLVEIYKENEGSKVSLASMDAERLIKRMFYNHISEVKSNKKLVDDFIWILNEMIRLGSSEAYLFRENVITYKAIL